jgi:hypothetical protein
VTLDLIIGVIVLFACAVIFVRWKLARVVIKESLTHPFRTTVIRVKSSNRSDAETPRNDKRNAQQQRVVVHN